MAETLVAEMEEAWKPEQYHDEYREDLMSFIEKKIKSGKTQTIADPVEEKEERKSADVIDLMSLLKKSVAKTARKPKKRTSGNESEKKARRRA